MICHKLRDIEKMVLGTGLQVKDEELIIKGISIDSRTVKSGNLFIPIKRQLDGHDYVEEAYSKGAIASLWQKDHPNRPSQVPLILVEDCSAALQNLAADYRRELDIKIIGVTGSNGKTTTKDMINSVLKTKYRVHKTKGNFNSQLGVPLTILEIDKTTEVAVIEMGMSERGQIQRLSEIVRPDIAIITMIGVSHLSTLGSRDEIAAAKMEIVKGLRSGGLLIYNGDEPLLTSGLSKMKGLKAVHFISFGDRDSNDYHAISSVSKSEGSRFTVGRNNYYIPLLGAHNISNALATIAVASKLGIDPTDIDKGLRSLEVTGMRMEKIVSPLGFTVINDAWNASPTSMKAAIKTFEDLTGYSKKYLVLGDMLELGEQEQEFHREVGRLIDPKKIDFVYTVGELSKHIALEAEKRFPSGKVQVFLDKKELVQVLKKRIQQDDIILLKGSRGIQLESILDSLLLQ